MTQIQTKFNKSLSMYYKNIIKTIIEKGKTQVEK